MNASEFLELVVYALEQSKHEEIEKLWISLYPFMVLKQIKFMPLNEFAEKAMGKNIDNRSIEEIEKDIQLARDRFVKGSE